MSYSINEARGEENNLIKEAILSADDVTLRRVAKQYAKQGDDDVAEHLHNLAKKAQRDQWAYDEANNN